MYSTRFAVNWSIEQNSKSGFMPFPMSSWIFQGGMYNSLQLHSQSSSAYIYETPAITKFRRINDLRLIVIVKSAF